MQNFLLHIDSSEYGEGEGHPNILDENGFGTEDDENAEEQQNLSKYQHIPSSIIGYLNTFFNAFRVQKHILYRCK